jgi:c-di-GMP-binding flagellar brake protein YcgR
MGWFGLSAQEEAFWNKFDMGQKVDLTLSIALREVYKTQIISREENMLVVMTPRTGSTVLEIPIKTEVLVKIYIDGGMFEFTSRVISQNWEDGYSISLEKPKKIEHIQLRQYYRINAFLPAEYAVVPTQDISFYDSSKISTNLSAITKDLSEGGLQLVVDRVIGSGTFLMIRINLTVISANTWVEAVGKVLSQEVIQMNAKYITRVQFASISEEHKEIIRKLAMSSIKKI